MVGCGMGRMAGSSIMVAGGKGRAVEIAGLLREGKRLERGGLSSGAHRSAQVKWWE